MPERTQRTASQRVREPAAPRLADPLTAARLPEHDLEDDGGYRSLEFRNLDLSARRVEGADFEGCRFVGAKLAGVRMRQGGFSDVELLQCDVSNLKAGVSGMHRTLVRGSRLTGTAWTESTFRDVVFDTCRAELAGFRFSTFKNVVFRDCTLTEADFQNAELAHVRFEGCDLSGAEFSNARMNQTRFSDCVLLGIRGVSSFRGATIGGRDAQGLVYALAGAMGITIED
ncbi:pentapeptide repeat-containing protein [Spongiactinospora rosea]|uniref:Pentapeptide repeat-containing protein n=1 Tax=Spongiactinospora rosea TaxID=2248750 RepID=A0A366M3U4_9ACTN|nr:pentapeptide repeat-containing protein [Spongiactinospora rosea]RBQ20865.1 pentapeptide repeat-containing protein [Spongiactinospora rosea]